ncbi:hypothetical protein [[Phormidium] sp. ETS-05]|uniref:hypothetical protein n=1 Tax=[Phormidium] sp. ETS-05 TaxID=222819 RepID=UPI0018EED141|nr:hypothetical protein [[Phormidium] sp. ETS-05]
MDKAHLEAGLAALKQGDYQGAIDHLETYSRQQIPKAQLWRAQMGLVAAYQGSGDINKAASLCQTLTQSQNEKVKAWAIRTLEKLPPPPPPTDPTGFIPLNTPDPTGFIPLDTPPVRGDGRGRGAGEQGSKGAREQGRRGAREYLVPPAPQPPSPPAPPLPEGAKAQLQTPPRPPVPLPSPPVPPSPVPRPQSPIPPSRGLPNGVRREGQKIGAP